MNWISKLERKFGRYAIQNLMFYVIALYTVGFALSLVAPEFYYQYLSLNIEAVFHGQIWRLVTFLMQPPNSSALFMVFALYLYYMITYSTLQQQYASCCLFPLLPFLRFLPEFLLSIQQCLPVPQFVLHLQD